MIRTASPRRRVIGGLAAMLAVPALLVGLSACAPAAGGGTGTPDAGSGQSPTLTDWQLQFAECMRGEGIDMPDPGTGTVSFGSGAGSDPAAVEAAGQKCRAELGDPPPMSADEKAAADQQTLEWGRKVAECYRENGYDMPDPKLGEEMQWPADVPEGIQQQCGGGADSSASTVTR